MLVEFASRELSCAPPSLCRASCAPTRTGHDVCHVRYGRDFGKFESLVGGSRKIKKAAKLSSRSLFYFMAPNVLRLKNLSAGLWNIQWNGGNPG